MKGLKMNNNAIAERAGFYPGFCFPRELDWLVHNARRQNPGSRWCEVGTLYGKSLIAVGLALPRPSTLVSIDMNWGRTEAAGVTAHDAFRELSNDRRLQLHAIRSTSIEAAEVYPDDWFDVVYIDAAHDYDSVRADIDTWLPKVKPGGMICGHDYTAAWPGVIEAVDESPIVIANSVCSIWYGMKPWK